eukprot:TRINITY_DN13936_c0_g1_i1.p1 TRINITY_DN13936_c0_g1~~TRINITY_DN13936_c0_g1_i1.p1  ORF type:complete len:304 (-),score=40.46 TRINITY_DN13936_c0_g1_i1:32-943(-)
MSFQHAEELKLFLPISQLNVFAKAWGPETGHPVLCVHGWLDNCHSFIPLVQRIFSARTRPMRVVAVDLPGHGLSEHRHPASITEFVTDISEISTALGWSRFSIIGHSMGSIIGMLFAAAFPERTVQLIILDALGPAPARMPAHKQLAEGIRSRTLLLEKSNRTFRSKLEAAKALRVKNESMSKESALLLVDRGTKPVEGGIMFRHDIQVRASSMQRFEESSIKEMMQDIKVPVLVVVAENGFIVESSAIERLQYVPKWAVARIPGGHHVHMDDADATAAVVLPFLEHWSAEEAKVDRKPVAKL